MSEPRHIEWEVEATNPPATVGDTIELGHLIEGPIRGTVTEVTPTLHGWKVRAIEVSGLDNSR